jgi:N-acetyl-1-D-myo-inositol-2-amino-2-deoxy-alpha-D-glucopyranoside deacetylase
MPSHKRLLLVHAHPDDESIETGGIMAKYAAEGAHVTLVTCTLGEEGEVIPPGLIHLQGRGDQLAAHRIGELDAACAALGVTDHGFLGGPGRWRDSGMMGTPANDRPGCFWQADTDEAARELEAIVRVVRPHVMVTYDERGFYGHPDHIQAHRVARQAFQQSQQKQQSQQSPGSEGGSGGGWGVAKFYATAVTQSDLARGIEELRAAGTGLEVPDSPADLPFGVPDEVVTTRIDTAAYLDAKLAAMRAHATQITVNGRFFALSNKIGRIVPPHEDFILLDGPRGSGSRRHGGKDDREDDLFAGIAGIS